MCLHLGRTQRDKNEGVKSCSSLLWINEARVKEKTYIWVSRGTGKPKDQDEVNRREVCECEGWVWDLDAIGAPSRLRLIRKAAVWADLHIIGVWRLEENRQKPFFFLFYRKGVTPPFARLCTSRNWNRNERPWRTRSSCLWRWRKCRGKSTAAPGRLAFSCTGNVDLRFPALLLHSVTCGEVTGIPPSPSPVFIPYCRFGS